MIAKYEKMRTWIVAHDMISILFGLVFCRFEHKFFGVVLFVCWLCFESGGLESFTISRKHEPRLAGPTQSTCQSQHHHFKREHRNKTILKARDWHLMYYADRHLPVE